MSLVSCVNPLRLSPAQPPAHGLRGRSSLGSFPPPTPTPVVIPPGNPSSLRAPSTLQGKLSICMEGRLPGESQSERDRQVPTSPAGGQRLSSGSQEVLAPCLTDLASQNPGEREVSQFDPGFPETVSLAKCWKCEAQIDRGVSNTALCLSFPQHCRMTKAHHGNKGVYSGPGAQQVLTVLPACVMHCLSVGGHCCFSEG